MTILALMATMTLDQCQSDSLNNYEMLEMLQIIPDMDMVIMTTAMIPYVMTTLTVTNTLL